MAESPDSRSERYLRSSHRTMVALLILTIVLGGFCLAMALDLGDTPRWMVQTGGVFYVAVVIGFTVLQKTTLRGERWDPKSPEVQAVLQDEWRRTNLDRAMRVAFIVVLIAQIPIGLLVAHLPSLRAVMAMAISTLTLGMATLIALFLFFSREEQDG